METINESSKLVARALTMLKDCRKTESVSESIEMFNGAIRLLDEALDTMAKAM